MAILTSGQWWAATGERAVKTAGQSFALAVGVNVVSVADLNWLAVGGVTLMGAILSVATSLASIPVGGDSGPSLGPEELKPPESTG
jgi:hypothetical protein